jgi:predicted DNA-binding transcriptional regulator AlpA
MRLTHSSRRCSGGANNSGNYWLVCFRNSSTSSSAQGRRTVRRFARGRRMTGTPKLPLQLKLSALPDWAVLTDQQTSGVLGLSLDTLRRLDRGRDGPPRVKLSPRRHGRPVGELRKWIQKRVGASLNEPKMQARTGSPGRKASHTADGAGARTQKLLTKGQSRTTP